MTPEEQFNKDVWWVLQAIKKEWLSTPARENVRINTVRSRFANTGSPPTDDIAKCIRKLEEQGAFRVVERSVADSLDPYHFVDVDWDRATEFLLSIHTPKFDELYSKYEGNQHSQFLTTADMKKLYILKKLKELRDLGGTRQVSIAEGRYEKWLAECDIEQHQLKDMLFSFMREGLIEFFEFKVVNPAV